MKSNREGMDGAISWGIACFGFETIAMIVSLLEPWYGLPFFIASGVALVVCMKQFTNIIELDKGGEEKGNG